MSKSHRFPLVQFRENRTRRKTLHSLLNHARYNSLSQLTAAANPESGAVNYPAYDANGNLKTRTDARGVTTSYDYDKLNRLLTISYAGGTNVASTPSVTYTYDDPNVAYSKGHLTSVSNSNSTTSYTAFDALGRVTASRQVVGGQTYNFVSYTYNLADALTGETYPSGRALAIGYDPANQTNAVSGTLGGVQTSYVGAIVYAPQGAPSAYMYGSLARSVGYNSRLQVNSIVDALASNQAVQLLNLAPDWGGANNNGTLQAITQNNGGPGYPQFLTFKDSFTYDGVNRLQTVTGKDGSNNVLPDRGYGLQFSVTAGSAARLPAVRPRDSDRTGGPELGMGRYRQPCKIICQGRKKPPPPVASSRISTSITSILSIVYSVLRHSARSPPMLLSSRRNTSRIDTRPKDLHHVTHRCTVP